MDIQLNAKIQNPRIILGFPGFGLVVSIAVEFLIDHLTTEKVGRMLVPEMPAMVAIHQKKVIDAISLYHDKQDNLLFVHGINAPRGLEWEAASQVEKLAVQVKAKEVISLEGVGSGDPKGQPQAYFHATDEKTASQLAGMGIKPLEEGIIIGLSAALLSTRDLPITCLFAETASELPDSKAAAEIIKVLDRYLGLEVDYKPLLVQAQKFEQKLKGLLSQSQKAQEMSEKKWMSYVG